MSLMSLPNDVVHLVVAYGASEDAARLEATCRRFRGVCGDAEWGLLCRREAGVAPGSREELVAAARCEGVWDGAVVAPQCVSGFADFEQAHAFLRPYYDLDAMVVDPIAVRVTTKRFTSPRHVHELRGTIEYLIPTEAEDDDAAAAAAPLTDIERVYHSLDASDGLKRRPSLATHTLRGEVHRGGAIRFVDTVTGLSFAAERAGKRALVGTHDHGGFYLLLAKAERGYAAVVDESEWEGVCMQHDYASPHYAMAMSVGRVSGCGVMEGEVTYPALKSVARAVGVLGAPAENAAVSNSMFASSIAPPSPGAVGNPAVASPLCTALLSPLPRLVDPHAPQHNTRLYFCEYEAVRKGGAVVPTYYCAEVSGDVIVGTYTDTVVYNHGTFCVRRVGARGGGRSSSSSSGGGGSVDMSSLDLGSEG
eukprot:TRINITY_DN2769_c1_g1_i6.p2 TRINITY_DN2769_c1_g1~~TRINITY_DN2769_c1_g1_i6.p2  ORF type:complete len:421 (+),score=143.71 TRINITY_DN2769_c1_g1_i6:90-1352(+)